MNRFLLTPHTESILEGRGLNLICSAPICLHQPKDTPDPLYGRDVQVKGFGLCKRCGHKTDIAHFPFKVRNPWKDHEKTVQTPQCEKCGSKSMKVTYTQYVVSKHRKSNHYYYHEECYEAMFRGDTLFKPKKYKTKYGGSRGKGVTVTLPFDPRKGVCQACGKSKAKGEIKYTCLHHWRYAYKPLTVKKNPILVLENTSEFCFACHMIADAFRNLMRLSPNRIMMVAKTMPPETKEKFEVICNLYLVKVKEWSTK